MILRRAVCTAAKDLGVDSNEKNEFTRSEFTHYHVMFARSPRERKDLGSIPGAGSYSDLK